MDNRAYVAIKAKLNNDKQEVENEIASLLEKRSLVVRKRENELDKLRKSTNALREKREIKAGLLNVRFNHEVMEKSEKEISLLDRYISAQKMELEKVKEQLKYLDELNLNEIKKIEKEQANQEERLLMEYVKWLN